jgi:hypothetical protein
MFSLGRVFVEHFLRLGLNSKFLRPFGETDAQYARSQSGTKAFFASSILVTVVVSLKPRGAISHHIKQREIWMASPTGNSEARARYSILEEQSRDDSARAPD